MLRALGLAALLALAGCGDDTTEVGPVDLAQPVLDLSAPGTVCGVSLCNGACVACVPVAGGLCAIPCNTATPSTCNSGRCNPAMPDGGSGGGVTFSGDCGAYDGVCG